MSRNKWVRTRICPSAETDTPEGKLVLQWDVTLAAPSTSMVSAGGGALDREVLQALCYELGVNISMALQLSLR